MPAEPQVTEPKIDLCNPALAALLAWLWPGAGHIYQGRTAKGAMFMACILGTFLIGFLLGEGRVVYASWNPDPFRWHYVCQVWAGGPALPALVEANRFRRQGFDYKPMFPDSWYAPPKQSVIREQDTPDELDQLNYRLGHYFEFGTVYTMVAGLLNVLVIYDAWAGPAYARKKEENPPENPENKGKVAAPA